MILTIENTKIIERLIERLSLKPGVITTLLELDDTVKLTLDLAEFLKDFELKSHQADPGGTGWYAAFTVPDNELWQVHAADVSRATGSTLTTTVIEFRDPGNGYRVRWGSWAASNDHIEVPTLVLPCKEKWEIRVYIAAHGGTDNVLVKLLTTVEKAF